MILVDTSVWIDHFRSNDRLLADLLLEGRVLVHSFVVGELALGGVRQPEIIDLLQSMPQARPASADEVMFFITANKLAGSGIGYVDAHLLASVRLSEAEGLWTRDRRLRQAADQLGIAVSS